MPLEKLIDNRLETWYPLMHAMLRPKTSTLEQAEQERLRSQGMYDWIVLHTAAMAKVLDEPEKELFGHVLDHLRDYKELPSRATLEEMVRRNSKFPEAQLDRLALYDEHISFQRSTDAVEMETIFKIRKTAWMQLKFMHATQVARFIAITGVESDDRRGPLRKGVPDAVNFLLEELHSGVFSMEAPVTGGSMEVLADKVVTQYDTNKAEAQANTLTIRTGIPLIDDEMHGYNRKTLNLILGTQGQRKSAVARTIAYYAATFGYRVLFIPMEWPVEEEIGIFAMMHAHNVDHFTGTGAMSIAKYNYARLEASEETFMAEELVGNLKTALGDKLVLRGVPDRSWPAMRAMIEAEDAHAPLDLVVIDYIGLIDCSQARDTTFQMNQYVREIKHMCMHHDGGRGLTVLAPVQGNRKGYDDAIKNGGMWEPSGIYQYSELEKSADTIMFTVQPEEMKVLNTMKIGFCKTRRHGVFQPQVVKVDPKVGLVGGSKQKTEEDAMNLPNRDEPDGDRFWGVDRGSQGTMVQ